MVWLFGLGLERGLYDPARWGQYQSAGSSPGPNFYTSIKQPLRKSPTSRSAGMGRPPPRSAEWLQLHVTGRLTECPCRLGPR